ncbi:MAG TPA: hypothetical protein VH639_11300 [Bryobacteraceae bacterium]|jgi:hypothetical protein
MRVEHLVIVTFPKRGDAETEGLGNALYDRYVKRQQFRPRTASVIRFPPNQFRNDSTLDKFKNTMPSFDVLKGTAPSGSSAVQTSDNVGAYIVCHGYTRRPLILGAQYSSGRCQSWPPEDYASVMANLLYGLGLRKLRKVCLMVCGTEEAHSSGDPRLAEVLSVALAKKMDSPPAVAGYDGYISAFWNKEDTDFPNAPEAQTGKKIIKISNKGNDKRVLASENRDAVKSIKFVSINGKTATLASSGWSDKDRGEDWTPTLDAIQ